MIRVSVCPQCKSDALVTGAGEQFVVRTTNELVQELKLRGLWYTEDAIKGTPDEMREVRREIGILLFRAKDAGLPESEPRLHEVCQKRLFPAAELAPQNAMPL